MEELSPVHRYAAGALFSLALNQAQIQRQSPVPEMELSEEDGPSYLTLSEEDGGAPWGSESCGLLRHVLRYLNIDPQAWLGIEITAAQPDAKHHIGPANFLHNELNVDYPDPGVFPRKFTLIDFHDWTFSLLLARSEPLQAGVVLEVLPLKESSCLLFPDLDCLLDWTKKTFSTFGMPVQFSGPAAKAVKLGVQATLKTFQLPPQLTLSIAEIQSSISTLGSSPRSSLSIIPQSIFNPSLPSQPRRQFIRILQEDSADVDLPSSTVPSSASNSKSEKPEKSVAVLAKAIDAMALSLEEFAEAKPGSKEKTFEETFAAHAASTENTQPSTSGSDSAQRWASMKKPLLERQGSDSQSPRGSIKNIEPDIPAVEDKEAVERRTLIKQRKVAVLYEVLTACVADTAEEKAGKSVLRAGYDARQRAAIRLLSLWLDVEWQKVAAIELMVAYMALAAEKEKEAEKAGQTEEKQGWQKWKRGGIIGAAALTGGVLLAVTGGLAAPAIAAGLTALGPVIGVGGLATVVGSAAGSAAVAASFGAAGAGLAGTKMARRTGGVEEFMFLPIGENHQQGRLAVGIMVSGIVLEAEDFTKPWEGRDWDLERYALRWETKELMAVSTAIEDWLASSAARELFKAGAMMTVLSGLVAALAWPATLLAATDWIDSKWTVAVDRSDKAGIVLAKCLLRGTQGNRPVTLVGFSLGARVIFSCLEYLAKKGDTASIVERVVLLGAPITLDEKKWKAVRKVVAGRFINAYSTNDWILGVIYRASFVTQGLAGLQSVAIPGIENIDVTEVVNGHSMYLSKTSEILVALDIDSFYPIYPSKLHAAPLALEAP